MTVGFVVFLVALNAVAAGVVWLGGRADYADLVAQHEHRRLLRRLARARRRARRTLLRFRKARRG